MNTRKSDKWATVDWSRQDVSLSKDLGVSRERVRQMRKQVGAGPAINHGRPMARKPLNPDSFAIFVNRLCQGFTELAAVEAEISRILSNIVRVKVARRLWQKSADRKKMQNHIRLAFYRNQNRARGALPKAEWMAKVTKPREHHIQKAREYLQRSYRKKQMSMGLAPWYKPEPRGRDGKLTAAMKEVIRARRQEYIDWWKPIYKMRANEWKLEHWESMRRSGHRRLSNAIRKRLHKFVNKPILTPTCELIGCSVGELKAHLERQFRPGWSWENYGKKWNIDHITPLTKFDLSQPAHVKLASHYTNLRPMAVWANSLKGDRMVKKAAQPFLPLASPVLMAA